MPKISQTTSQNQKQGNRAVLSSDYIQRRVLITSHNHEINQIVHKEVAQNPAFYTFRNPDFADDIKDDDDQTDQSWNQNFAKPYDENESGEAANNKKQFAWADIDVALGLEQSALEYAGDNIKSWSSIYSNIDIYRNTGKLPADADKKFQEDLQILEKSIFYKTLPNDSPTFEVYEDSGKVHAVLIPTVADSLIYRKGFGAYSYKAKKFIDRVIDRTISLSNLAVEILEKLQGDFFRNADFKNAMLNLTPIPTETISDLKIEKFTLKRDKKLISRLSDLSVSCKFGMFPLGLFMPSKAALLRIWLYLALPKEISRITDQLEWVKQHAEKRVRGWEPNDMRIDLMRPLLDTTANDIKNAKRRPRKNK
jgi:hypothetical protein